MVDRRLVLLLAFGVIGSCVADDDDALNIAQETSGVTSQTVVQDNKGGEIKIVTTIRDTSWPASISYNFNSYYGFVPEQSFDKITIRETTSGNLGYLLSTFISAVPRQWNPCIDKTIDWHLDLFDALSIGAKDANPVIVQRSLEKLPYTKAALASGKSTDFMNQAFSVDGKFKIDSIIDDACDTMAIRINKYRVNKIGSLVYAASLAIPGVKYVASAPLKFGAQVLSFGLSKFANDSIITKFPASAKDVADAGDIDSKNIESRKKVEFWLNGTVAGLTVVSALLAHRLQHIYINGYIKVLDLLISAETVAFDHAVAYKKINELKDKLVWFGISNQQAEQLQAVLNKL